MRFRALAAVTLLTALALAGCAGLPSGSEPSPTPTPLLAQLVAELPGVEGAQEVGADVVAEIARDASDATVLAIAEEAAALAEERSWEGSVILSRARGPLDPETDIQPPSPWSQAVYPGDAADVRATLTELLAIEKVPGVASVAFVDDRPHVAIAPLDAVLETFRTLRERPSFADGGTYSYLGERPRLTIVHLPERMSSESIEAVIRIAVENPESEVELQSLTTPGNRWPELWVARLTEEQRARVDAQLRDPSLADTDPEGYSIPFQLSVLGPNGPELSWGTFGDVPDTSS